MVVAGEPDRVEFYNAPVEVTQGDLTFDESLRWDVLPLGVLPKTAKVAIEQTA